MHVEITTGRGAPNCRWCHGTGRIQRRVEGRDVVLACACRERPAAFGGIDRSAEGVPVRATR